MLEVEHLAPADVAPPSHAVTLFPSGTTFLARDDETILDAASRSGLLLPHQCKTGQCGACKARLLDGDAVMDAIDAPALSPEEAAQGVRLLCCSRARGALQVECAEIPHIPGIEVRKLPVRIAAMEKMAPDVMRVQLQPPAGQVLQYAAGQYVDVLLPGNRRRSYSLATRPGEAMLELHIRHMAGGLFTEQLFGKLKARDVLRIEGPFGTFGMHTASDAPAILLASGTGLAPIRALVQQLMATQNRRPVSLYWGGRILPDLYMHDECLQWVATLQGQLRYVPVLSESPAEDAWKGRTGFVHQAVMQDHPDLSGHEVYACGAPLMIEAARRDFAARCEMRATSFFADAFVARVDP